MIVPRRSLASIALACAALVWPAVALTQPDVDDASAAYQQALAALQNEEWARAELWLERTLMLQPENAEALLELALLLAARDRHAAAQALVATLLADPRTPEAHRERLAVLHANLEAVPRPAAPQEPRTQLALGLGFSHNPLALPSASHIRLSLPGGEIELPLKQARHSGALANLTLQHRWGTPAAAWDVYLQTQRVAVDSASPANYLALAGPLPPDLPFSKFQLSLQQGLDGSRREQFFLVRDRGPGSLYAGLYRETQSRHHGLWLRAQWHQGQPWPSVLPDNWALLHALEYEHARGESGSNPPDILRWSLDWHAILAPRWQMQGRLQWQTDTSGYSPLLKNNAPRRFATAQLGLHYHFAQPVGGGWVTVGASVARRWSNLELFAWKNATVELSWRQQW